MQKLLANLITLALLFGGCTACMQWVSTLEIKPGNPQAPAAARQPDQDTLRINAVFEAQNAVKRLLKSPSSAKWPSVWNGVDVRTHATLQEGGRYLVRSYVDAQNSFGAMMRVNYTAVVQPVGKGWSVIDVRLEE